MENLKLPDHLKCKCLFCGSEEFKKELVNNNVSSSKMYQCANCGEKNDYEGMISVAKDELAAMAKEEILKTAKDLFKKFK